MAAPCRLPSHYRTARVQAAGRTPAPHRRPHSGPWERGGRGSIKKPNTPPAPPVAAITDHLLGEILRRLPDMASLLSDALACKSWGRVASDPAVFRRFFPLRRPPLVGFILTDRGAKPVPFHNPNPRFVTASSRHPKLASAASDGDFYHQEHPEIDDGDPHYANEWRLRGCDGGLLLLSRGRYGDEIALRRRAAPTSSDPAPPPLSTDSHAPPSPASPSCRRKQ